MNVKELVQETAASGFIKTEEEAKSRLEDSLKKDGFTLEPLDGKTPESKYYFKVMG